MSNPYAPNLPPTVLWLEHASFAGNNIGEIFYGMVIILYFQTIAALLSPFHRKGKDIKWGLVGYSTVMFGLVTTFTAMNVRLQQLAYIDNREFPGVANVLPPGPIGWSLFMYSKPLVIVPNACFIIANWMADGLLMYRCYVIYNMQRWVMIFPLTLFLASISMGVITLYLASQPNSNLWRGITVNFGLPYFTISVGLNVVLTLMISIRLLLHSRNIQGAMGSTGIGSLYRSIATMLIESSALYAVTSLLFIGPYAANNYASDIFLPILAEVQVIAPLLIIRRVATQNALTGTTVVSGAPSSGGMTFRSRTAGQTTTTGSNVQIDYPLSSIDNKYGNRSYEETTVDLPAKV